MRSCYLAGAMRGVPQYNYPAFMAGAEALRVQGWEPVYNPAAMDIEEDPIDYTERSIEDQRLFDTYSAARRFARRDVNVLLNKLHAEDGDAIVLLPGWEDSTGATAEVAVARWVGLRVYTIAEALSGRRESK